jgi:outer membrane protein OmpA-like peptidoglycan-associated protein
VLGRLSWNIQRWRAGFLDQGSSTTVRRAACVEDASAEFSSVVESFYSASGMVILDGFAAGSADLPATHAQRLGPIVDRLRREPARRVIVGGAATQDELNPAALSRSRAERAKTYLVGQGIAESRIDVEAYSSDWARTPVTSPGAAQANRRVQITIS